jgi:Leucine-rich repeat (LRR) protein
MPKTFLYQYVEHGDSRIIQQLYNSEHGYYIARVNKNPDSKKYMHVDINGSKKFPKIPKDIYYLDIDFWEQKIEYPEIPEHIKSLTFYNNKISKFPKNLPKGLLRLSFSGCINITEIPDISYLKKLRSFEFFRGYPMKDINPSQLPQKLERLEIIGTGLTKFPLCLPQSLKRIDFSHQKIKTFPDINYLKKLKKFTMLRNPLEKFPKETPRKDIYIELVDLNYPKIERGMIYPPSGYIPTKLKKPFDKAYSNQMKMVYSR